MNNFKKMFLAPDHILSVRWQGKECLAFLENIAYQFEQLPVVNYIVLQIVSHNLNNKWVSCIF